MRPALLLALALPIASGARAQWTIQPAPTTADLRGIHAVSADIAWASGTGGTVLRTTDSGAHWVVCPTPRGAEKLDFRGIQAFDADTAIVMSSGKGDLSRLYKTKDSCTTWKLLFTNPDPEGFWDAVTFNRGGGGFLLGDSVDGRFTLYFLIENGESHVRLTNHGLEALPGEAAFAASNGSLALIWQDFDFVTGGIAGGHFYSEDGCAHQGLCPAVETSWSRHAVPVGAMIESGGAFALAGYLITHSNGLSNKVLVIVGGDYKSPDDRATTAATSFDAGRNWLVAQTPPNGYRSSVAYSADTKTWITVGPNGTDISTDDGRNWRALRPGLAESPDAALHWNALSLPYVVGPHGRIGRLRPEALTTKP